MKNILIGTPVLTILSVCISLIVTPVQADDLTVFSNGKVADANEVNANFNELETRIKTISLTPGETGAVGAQGIQGSPGFTGATGAQGIQGSPGDAGTNGTNGTNGEAGDKGDAGAAGQNGADGVMYDGAFEGDMQYWNGNAWIMITAPTVNADSLSFCAGKPTWTQGGCPGVGSKGPSGGTIVLFDANTGEGMEAFITLSQNNNGMKLSKVAVEQAHNGVMGWHMITNAEADVISQLMISDPGYSDIMKSYFADGVWTFGPCTGGRQITNYSWEHFCPVYELDLVNGGLKSENKITNYGTVIPYTAIYLRPFEI